MGDCEPFVLLGTHSSRQNIKTSERQSLLNNNTTIGNSGICGNAALHMVRSLQVELELALNSAGQTCYTVNTIAQWYYTRVSFIVIAYVVFHKYLKMLFLFA